MTFAGYETRVLELEGDGLPLLLLHGYADSADTWRQCLAALARTGRRTVALDLPGFGDADPLLSEPILPQLDAFVEEAAHYAAGRPRQPVLVVGNSLGGCAALRLAERHGNRLAGVLAAAPAGLQMSRLLALVERDPLLHSMLALPAPVPAMVLRATVGRLYRAIAFSSPRAVDAALVSTFTQHHRSRSIVAGYLETAHRLIPELRAPFDLGRIAVPVLVVWGDRDKLLFASGASEIIERVPGSRLELLEGVGHCPQVESPQRMTELILEFSDELTAAPA